jgi:hypothetical protein
MAKSVALQLRWGSIWFSFVAAIALFYGSPCLFTWAMLRIGRDSPLTRDDWLLLIFYSVLCFITGIWVFWGAAKFCLLTKIEERGIRQRHLRSLNFTPWSEVTRVRQLGFSTYVIEGKKKIILSPAVIKNWQEVADFIRARVPTSTFELTEGDIRIFK